MTVAFSLPLVAPATPAKAVSPWSFIRGSYAIATGVLTTVALPNLGAHVSLELIDVRAIRRLHLFAAYDANGAGAAGGRMSIFVAGASTVDVPASNADAWYPLALADTPAAYSMAGAFPAFPSGGFTAPVDTNLVTAAPAALATRATVANTDRIREKFPGIDVEGCRWVQIWIAEDVTTGTPGSSALAVAGSV